MTNTENDQSCRAGDGIPAGSVLVPREPTMAMVNAFHATSDSDILKRGYCRARWDAMLAAAPAAAPAAVDLRKAAREAGISLDRQDVRDALWLGHTATLAAFQAPGAAPGA